MRANFVHVPWSSSVPGIRFLILYALLPAPSSGSATPAGRCPDYALLELVRLPCRRTSALPFLSLLEASVGSSMALPSSNADRWMTCHGLRPRPGPAHSPWARVLLASEHETLGPAATMKITGLNTFTCVMADHPPSFGFTQFVTSLCAKFCSGLVVSLWPGRIVRLICIGLSWRTSSRHNMVSHLGMLCIPCCSALSGCGVSHDSTM